ncbi:hypothetical protein PENTCL1PPCAC_28706 [Pristionchus entomophagus]|uniref:G protein-coupled receptor n=1 Tax=Pristionchus entomophagus TaxID=358040 RepID=A0AAV5UHU6_9BILA|nr:hypothetical protein PENTCL1PPCAC_28706 [Pristionchus entomophagus]
MWYELSLLVQSSRDRVFSHFHPLLFVLLPLIESVLRSHACTISITSLIRLFALAASAGHVHLLFHSLLIFLSCVPCPLPHDRNFCG